MKTIFNRFHLRYPRPPPSVVEHRPHFRNQRKKDTFWCPFRWLRRWDLNLTTSGLWARRATKLLYSAIWNLGLPCGAGDRGRTGTILSYHGILSPGRLPIPPHRQIACQGSFLPLALSIITHIIFDVKPFFTFLQTFLFFCLCCFSVGALFLFYAERGSDMQKIGGFFLEFSTFVHKVEKRFFAYFLLTRNREKFSTGQSRDKPLKTQDFLSFPQFQQLFPQLFVELSKNRGNVKIA